MRPRSLPQALAPPHFSFVLVGSVPFAQLHFPLHHHSTYPFVDAIIMAIFSRREIEGLIANGDDIVIFEDTVLRLNAWKDKHPGGNLVIQHMVGRDATDEMNM